MTPLRARAVLPWFAGLWLAASAASVAQTGASEPAPPAEAEAPPAVRVLRTGGLRVETAALLLSGQQGGPVALEARALPLPGKIAGAPDKGKVAVVIEAASRALARAAAAEGLPLLPVDVVVYALDGRGALAGSVIETEPSGCSWMRTGVMLVLHTRRRTRRRDRRGRPRTRRTAGRSRPPAPPPPLR